MKLLPPPYNKAIRALLGAVKSKQRGYCEDLAEEVMLEMGLERQREFTSPVERGGEGEGWVQEWHPGPGALPVPRCGGGADARGWTVFHVVTVERVCAGEEG